MACTPLASPALDEGWSVSPTWLLWVCLALQWLTVEEGKHSFHKLDLALKISQYMASSGEASGGGVEHSFPGLGLHACLVLGMPAMQQGVQPPQPGSPGPVLSGQVSH